MTHFLWLSTYNFLNFSQNIPKISLRRILCESKKNKKYQYYQLSVIAYKLEPNSVASQPLRSRGSRRQKGVVRDRTLGADQASPHLGRSQIADSTDSTLHVFSPRFHHDSTISFTVYLLYHFCFQDFLVRSNMSKWSPKCMWVEMFLHCPRTTMKIPSW